MLYQPTNVSPSSLSGLGNGVVDATKDLPVSWQVNGNSAMTAFSITIYKNDAASTQVYTTGKITDGCPFFGTGYDGNVQFFSYTIAASALSGAGVSNGEEYKLIITQWWSESDSVVQTAASAFITRSEPTLSVDSFSSPLAVRAYTFAATYSQAQGDGLMWFRWYIAELGSVTEFLLDTGNVYGTNDVRVTYDGFFNGGQYMIRCVAQTVNGVSADTGWTTFSVSYDVAQITGALIAQNYCGAVHLSWPHVRAINGEADGDYSILPNGAASIPEGTTITWGSMNGGNLELSSPFSVAWKGSVTPPCTPFAVTGGENSLSCYVTANSVAVIYNGRTIFSTDISITNRSVLTVMVTPGYLYLKIETTVGGLLPSATLYPSLSLYPDGGRSTVRYINRAISYTGFSGNNVTLSGVQVCHYIWIFEGTPTQDMVDNVYSENYIPAWSDAKNTQLLCAFENGLQAGNLITDTGEMPEAMAIYRQKEGESALTPVATAPLSVIEMLDWAVENGANYVYYAFAVSDTIFMSQALMSQEVAPFTWDWLLISCDAEEENGAYHINGVYRFGKNLSSDSISNNNAPTLLENFTRYPLWQGKSANYKSGVLTSLIGKIEAGKYSDTAKLRDEIMELSTSNSPMALRSRKGDVWGIKIASPITFTVTDAVAQQPQSMAIPWAQVEDAFSMIMLPTDPAWPM